ncbi:hypothetical protein DFH28DRAFT_1080247 [Melampsora americana]|nr:hypothetical protein DFH28DRAFT_1080247 [Melampsora americana]
MGFCVFTTGHDRLGMLAGVHITSPCLSHVRTLAGRNSRTYPFGLHTHHLSPPTSVASMREFDILPVIDSQTRRFVQDDIRVAMYQFLASFGTIVITPGTPLEKLAEFFKSERFAIVTDTERRFVLAIVVREDLEK